MKLILTRHGKTGGNANGIIQDQLAGDLTEEGIRQAQKLAERLHSEKIDYIYSSDAVRAADTAKEIAKLHPTAPISFIPDLRERHFGEFIGMKKEELSVDAIYLNPKEGESLQQVYIRVKNFLVEVLAKHGGETVLFVGHGLTNKPTVALQ